LSCFSFNFFSFSSTKSEEEGGIAPALWGGGGKRGKRVKEYSHMYVNSKTNNPC
jgi:hypothetical protein